MTHISGSLICGSSPATDLSLLIIRQMSLFVAAAALLLCLPFSHALQQGGMDRRRALHQVLAANAAAAVTSSPLVVQARNLPESTGATLTQTGTVETLVPVIRIQQTLEESQGLHKKEDSIPRVTKQLLSTIPSKEVDFKRLFDEFSDPVSYKQRYLDQNAFLVYYTKGFDGPNRPSIEADDENIKQVMQFGARNEAWIAWNDLQSELQFVSAHPEDSGDDLLLLLSATLQAVNRYLALAPSDVLAGAKKLL